MTSVRRNLVFCLLSLALVSVIHAESAKAATDGELTVTVTRNGKPSEAELHVLVAGATQEVASGRTDSHEGAKPQAFQIPAGVYDVVIKSLEMAGRPEYRIEGMKVEGGGSYEVSHEFTSGTLRLGATRNGGLMDAFTTVIDLESGDSVGHGRTYDLERSNPRVFHLAPGQYQLKVDPLPKDTPATRVFEVVIVVGETIEHMVDFTNRPASVADSRR